MNDIATGTKIKKKSKLTKRLLWALTIFIALSSLAIVSVLFPHFKVNLFFVTFETYYFIPDQGSIFTFQPTAFNSGSELFWLYGEDKSYYYCNSSDYFDGKENTIAFPKNKAASCSGFDPKNVSTWCR